MSELRHDPIQKRWVIIATDRGKRPGSFPKEKEDEKPGAFCPFCEGNESSTPPEIWAMRHNGSAKDTPGWSIRVVPNKFPALAIEGGLQRKGIGLFDLASGVGAHEVVIESPNHRQSIADLPADHVERVLQTARDRLVDLHRDKRFKYVLIFKNHGSAAGASLAHPHLQIIATPVTPKTVAVELDSCRLHFSEKERCLYCDILSQELDSGERVVARNEHFVALAPYASRFPFELEIAPLRHQHDFGEIPENEMQALAAILQDVLKRLKVGLSDPPYNFVFHTSPNTAIEPRRVNYWATIKHDWHWHIEILPRLTKVAGFEWGTGLYINPTPPELAAAFLRDVAL
jgi:UDPglucose--hexose-1-phosphate uridylyltransferase